MATNSKILHNRIELCLPQRLTFEIYSGCAHTISITKASGFEPHMQNSYRHTNGKYRFRPYLSCSSGRRFHQISLLPSINPPCSVQGRSFINFRCKLHFLESMGNLVSLPFIAESFANKKRSTHLSWEELDLNQQNPKVPDLQSGPLPITVYLPSTGMRPLATSLSCICFTLSGLQPFTGNSFIQLPRKTGRTISSHPQAFPLALSVHMQNCHWCFRENLSKVFTRTALTVQNVKDSALSA